MAKKKKASKKISKQKALIGWLLKAAVLIALCLMFLHMFFISLLSGYNWGRTTRPDPAQMELKASSYIRETRLTDSYAGVMHILELPIERNMTGGNDLGLWVVHSYIDVYFGGELVYTCREPSTPHIGHSPGCYWAFVPLKTTDAGKVINIVVRPAYKNMADRLPKIVIGRRDKIIGYRFLEDMGMAVAAFCCIIAGILFSILSLISNIKKTEHRAIFYMGIALADIGLWKFTDLPSVVAVFTPQAHLLTYISLIALLFFSPAITGYLSWLYKKETVYVVLNRIFLYFSLTIVLMQMLGIRDLRENLHLIQLQLAICIVFMLEKSIYSLRYRDNNWHKLAFIAFGITGFGDLTIYLYGYDSFHLGLTLTMALFYAIINGVMVLAHTANQEEELHRQELELKASRMQLMMSQIRPHFIYNTLNAIYVLCGKDPERARRAIYDFSKYLRINFQNMDKNKPVPFKEELEHVKFYISIEQLRFSDALEVVYDIEEDDFELPALSLQPVVENAVRHGIRGKKENGKITISTFRMADGICLAVEDDGEGFDVGAWERNLMENDGEDEDGRRHVGLANVRERIRQAGGEMLIQSTPGKGTSMIIVVPVPKKGGQANEGIGG